MERLHLSARDGLVSGALVNPAGEGGLVACIHGGGCHAGYFEMTRPSIVDLATARGHAVLLVTRPGTGGLPLADGDLPLLRSVPRIRGFIDEVRRAHLPGRKVGLVGHSIGAAIALTIAAEPRDWPLAAVAVSGIGDEPPPRVRTWMPDDADFGGLGGVEMAAYLLGAEGTYDWQALLRLRKVAAPWNSRERWEVVQHWPERWRDLAGRIDVPVQLRMADGEKIWLTGESVVERMAARLTRVPLVDAALLPDGGHLYELHKRGPELAAAQVAFLDRALGSA